MLIFRKKRPQLVQGVFFYSGNIGTADVKMAGNFSLCLFFFAQKSETAADHLILFVI